MADTKHYLITAKHAESLKRLAESKDIVSLYESPSLSGDSMTLRARVTWHDAYYNTVRTYSSMIFSAKVYKHGEAKANPQMLVRFENMVSEAKALFEQYRQEYLNR